jgi:ribosomal protein S18 acetylase RimI-like enzyme/8-oxo-dGTP pyrophosphatase MutT (NUDIX family)
VSISLYLSRLREAVGHELLLLPSVAVLVWDDDGRLLLVREANTGLWQTIGGAIEPDESPHEAAIREAHEEASVSVRIERIRGVAGGPQFRLRYPNGDLVGYVTTVFDACVVDGAPQPDGDETIDVGWFSPQELSEAPFTEFTQALFEAAGVCVGNTRQGTANGSPRAGHRIKLRSANPQDISSVLNLWRIAGGPLSVSDTPEGIARLLTRDPDALLVAESGGVVVGSLIAAWDGWRGSFYKLVVHPEHRRQGLATELLREGESCLRARGTVRLTAIVAEDDPAAIAFWEAAVYQRQPQRARFIQNDPESEHHRG